MSHLLTESIVVFIVGGAAGVLLAFWGLSLVNAVEIPAPVPVDFRFGPDLRVLGFALILTLGTGLIFGLLPAVQATRLDLVPTLKDEGSRGRSASGRMRRFFVASQVGFSLVLLVSAGLVLRSLQLANQLETDIYSEAQKNNDFEIFSDQ